MLDSGILALNQFYILFVNTKIIGDVSKYWTSNNWNHSWIKIKLNVHKNSFHLFGPYKLYYFLAKYVCQREMNNQCTKQWRHEKANF